LNFDACSLVLESWLYVIKTVCIVCGVDMPYQLATA